MSSIVATNKHEGSKGRLVVGDQVKSIKLPGIDGAMFDLESVKGQPFMLSFFRFASCPFCNLRINELVRRFDEFGDDFTVVAVFDSPLDNLVRHAEDHSAPFPILADEQNHFYKEYGIEHSVTGMLKGMFFRMPTLVKGMIKYHMPSASKESLTTMPADFLVNRDGIIEVAHYGSDGGDHLSFDKVKAYSKR